MNDYSGVSTLLVTTIRHIVLGTMQDFIEAFNGKAVTYTDVLKWIDRELDKDIKRLEAAKYDG